jgi:hypothetical protein
VPFRRPYDLVLQKDTKVIAPTNRRLGAVDNASRPTCVVQMLVRAGDNPERLAMRTMTMRQSALFA